MDHPVIDHRGPEFAKLGLEILSGMRNVFRTTGPVVVYPASGTGAWEAAIVNTLSPGDHVLMFETGHFSLMWRQVAERFGLQVELVPGNWRSGASAADVEARLGSDKSHSFKAVMVVHNETSTGVTSRIPEIRRAMDRVHHPALLIVDTISSLAAIDYRHDEWQVDVTIAGSQKGLMLPPGLSFNAISDKALAANKSPIWNVEFDDCRTSTVTGPNDFFAARVGEIEFLHGTQPVWDGVFTERFGFKIEAGEPHRSNLAKPHDVIFIHTASIWNRIWRGDLVFRHFSGQRIHHADLVGRVLREPDVIFGIDGEAARIGFLRRNGILRESTCPRIQLSYFVSCNFREPDIVLGIWRHFVRITPRSGHFEQRPFLGMSVEFADEGIFRITVGIDVSASQDGIGISIGIDRP